MRIHLSRSAIAVTLAAVAACGDDGGGGDKGPDPDAPPVTATVDVTGRSTVKRVTETEVSAAAGVDLSATPIEAIQGDRVFTGEGRADGTFVIPDVPEGDYVLHVGSSYYAAAGANRDLTFATTLQGRADVVPSTNPATTLSISFGGLSPWQTGDVLSALVMNADTFLFDIHTLVLPVVGETTLAGTASYAELAFPPNLLEELKGDRARVVQLTRRSPAAGVDILAVARAGIAQPVTMVEGGDATLSATLSAVPQTQPFTLDLKRSQFAALRPVGSTAVQMAFTVQAVHADVSVAASSTADLVSGFYAPDGGDLVAPTIMYGDPYPASWSRFVGATFFYSVNLTVPGATSTLRRFGSIYTEQAVGGTIAPLVGAPTNVAFDIATRTVSWGAPAVGENLWYDVTVNPITVSGTGAPASTNIARFTTTGRSLAIPASLMPGGGKHYYLRVTAHASAAPAVPPPITLARPYGSASNFTSTITIP